jgi:hypothetical protein
MSLELRWFFQGKIPDEIKRWFNKGSFDNEKFILEKEETFQDIYLFNPEVNYSSVKFRNENFGIKWRKNTYPIAIRINKTKIAGIAEEWKLWELKDDKISEEIQLYMDRNDKHPWIKINKNRQRYHFKISDTTKEHLEPETGRPNADFSMELTNVILEKNQDISWWTIGIDLFDKSNSNIINKNNSSNYMNNDHGKKILEKISRMLLENYPHNNLLEVRSYGYPQLFSLYADLIKSSSQNNNNSITTSKFDSLTD